MGCETTAGYLECSRCKDKYTCEFSDYQKADNIDVWRKKKFREAD